MFEVVGIEVFVVGFGTVAAMVVDAHQATVVGFAESAAWLALGAAIVFEIGLYKAGIVGRL